MNNAWWLFRTLAVIGLWGILGCRIVWGDDSQDFENLKKQFVAAYNAGKYTTAEPFAKQLVELAEEKFADKPVIVADALNRLALVWYKQLNYTAAEPLYQRALKIREQALGPEHRDVATSLNNLAELYRSQAKYEAAEPLYQRALKIREKVLGPEHRDVAQSLSNLANLYQNQGKYEVAEPLYQRAVKMREKALGPEHRDVAISLSKLAVLYHHFAKYEAAEPVFQRVLQINEKSFGLEHPEVAVSLNNLANLYSDQAKYELAEPLYQRALKIRENVLGLEHPDVATSLNNLGQLYRNQANYAAAEPLYQRALTIRKKSLGPDHNGVSEILNNLASLYRNQAKYEVAEPLYQQALRIREKAIGAEHGGVSEILNNLAELYRQQANYAAAEPLYQRAIKIKEKSFGPDHPALAVSLNNLALLYVQQANYVAAEPLYQRAIMINEKKLGSEHPSLALSLNNLAMLYVQQANFAAAEPLYQRALQIYDKRFGSEHPDAALPLNNLALLYVQQANFAAAEPLYRRALKIKEEKLGSEHPSLALSLNNLALLYFYQANYAAAEPLYQRALQIYEKRFGSEHPDAALSLNNLALLHVQQANYAAAEPLYQRALTIYDKTLTPEHPRMALSLNNLAGLYERVNRTVEGAQQFDRARRGIRRHVVRVLPGLSDKEQSQFLRANYDRSYSMALSLAVHHSAKPPIVTQAASWVLNGKGVAQEALVARNLITRDIKNPELAPIVKSLLQIQKQLASLAMTAAEPGKEAARQTQLAQLTSEEQRLSRQLGMFGATDAKGDWIELEQLRKALPTDSVFIDIVRMEIYNFHAEKDEKRYSPPHYVAWITQPVGKQDTVLVDLGLADEIDSLIGKIRKDLQAAATAEGPIKQQGEQGATEILLAGLRPLAGKIWQPLTKHLGTAKQIILSPDGPLWLVPWNALPVEANGDKYLIEEYGLRYVISGRDLIMSKSAKQPSSAVILANPVFDQQGAAKQSSIQAIFKTLPPADDTTTRSFAAKGVLPQVVALPNTQAEALAVQPNLEKYTGGKSILYTEQYALESVAKALVSPRVATFATHGFFLPKQEVKQDDRERMAGNDTNAAMVDTLGKPIENPLLRCGLLLAGCNNRNASVGDDDGILTGMEIVGIDFRGTELIVLSACETGIGDLKSGEGVAGLRQAFQLAGAKAVVASLWQVPDRDTALLMNRFFENLANGQTKAEALRASQLARIAQRRERAGAAHPFFWAAFSVTGE